mmetsp:Transcript_43572/g.114535  ORF Transcript_43572/g.114535 Transcript_43572/m.114535 type:complete len:105 (+) Transcript_43572:929-1243(+)
MVDFLLSCTGQSGDHVCLCAGEHVGNALHAFRLRSKSSVRESSETGTQVQMDERTQMWCMFFISDLRVHVCARVWASSQVDSLHTCTAANSVKATPCSGCCVAA